MQQPGGLVIRREIRGWQAGWWLVVGGGVAAFLLAPGLLPDKLMALAAGVCPQRASHSYFMAGLQLPLEARMLGIFGGFLGTVGYAWLSCQGRAAQLPSRRAFAALVGLIALTAGDGLNATAYDLELGALYPPDNALRLATGLLAGVAMALLFLPVCNAWTWRAGATRPTPRRRTGIGGPLAVAALIWLATVSGGGWAFYPLALLATGGLLLAAAMLNVLLVLSVSRRLRTIAGLAELAPYGVLALALAAGELAALAALRVALLGVYL